MIGRQNSMWRVCSWQPGRQIRTCRGSSLAKELYEDDPQVLGNAASMRSVCILHGDPEKGADLLDSREDLGLLGSDCAAYYALVLSACGRGDEARQARRQLTARHCCPSCAHRWIARSERLRRTPPRFPRNDRELLRRVERTCPVSSPSMDLICGKSPLALQPRCWRWAGVTHCVPGELTSMPETTSSTRIDCCPTMRKTLLFSFSVAWLRASVLRLRERNATSDTGAYSDTGRRL